MYLKFYMWMLPGDVYSEMIELENIRKFVGLTQNEPTANDRMCCYKIY